MRLISNTLNTIRKFFSKTFDVYNYFFLTLLFLITAYPFWYIFILSVSDYNQIYGFALLPKELNLELYKVVLNSENVLSGFFISVSRSISGPLIRIVVCILVAYPLSHRALPGRKFFTLYFILTMYFSAGLIPKYLLFRTLGLTGTFWVYIFPTAMTAFTMIIMRTYVETIPKELEESAFIDGANEITIFFRIIMPLCIPVIAAMGLFACVWHWNSYTDTLIYNLGKEHLYTLQFVLVNFVRSVATSQSPEAAKYLGITNIQSPVITPMGVRMAIIFITIVPISLVYPFLQRYFIKGILVGSIKG